jgi:CubicO group peptidase (beta-lactamase class C family)/ribosomal protein S18 acetylase RimI-like enzyme
VTATSPLSLRQYTAADREAVLEVHRLGLQQAGRDAAPGPWDIDLDHIDDYYLKLGEFLVGECDGRIVAIGGLRMLASHVGELKRMRIHPDYFGRGYDQSLLTELSERARELGARRLVLDIDERRVPAQELYARNGFVAHGTLLVGRTPSIVYEKSLHHNGPGSLSELLNVTLEEAGISGIAVASRHGGEPPRITTVGVDVHGASVNAQSLFPAASLTKLAVALAVLRLVDQHALELDTPIHRLVSGPLLDDGITVRRLLCHTAGVPEMPLSTGGDWKDIGRSCLETPAQLSPGTRVLYSNLGYGLFGLLLEQMTGTSFGKAMRSLVLEPLDLDAHVADALPRAPVQGWRFRVLPAGGVFMTASAALSLVDAYRHTTSGFLRPSLLAEAVEDQTEGVGGGIGPRLQWTSCPWGLGPEIRGQRYSPWIPRSASAASFGHAGASGCVAWSDPEINTSWAILTVPPSDRSANVRWHLQRRPNLSDIGEAILGEIQSS